MAAATVVAVDPAPLATASCAVAFKRRRVTFQGESLTYPQPGWHCENGDDGILEGSNNDYPTGKVFGGGPTAFYKYETAKAVPSEGMANLLRLALERSDLFTKPARAG